MNCIQCNTESTGKFCPECGQKQDVPRLTLKTFFEDFFNRIYGLDGAVPNTIIGLWKHPGKVAQEYIDGIRGKYVGPVGYYFLMFTLFFILIAVFEVDMNKYTGVKELNDTITQTTGEELNEEKLKFQKTIQQTVFKNLQYLTILFFPIFALWAKVFYKKSNYNILESIVFLFFVNAQMLFFNMVGIIIFILVGEPYKLIINIFGITFFAWAASQFYIGKVTFKNIIKSTFFYIVSFISLFIFIMLITIIAGFFGLI